MYVCMRRASGCSGSVGFGFRALWVWLWGSRVWGLGPYGFGARGLKVQVFMGLGF